MNTIPFDTHGFVKRLVTAGMPERQAEVLAQEQTRLIESSLATKHDIRETEQRLTIHLGGMMVTAVAAVAALVKLL